MMVFISKEKLHVSAYSGHLQFLMIFCKRVIYRVSQEECARLREGIPYVKV